MVILQLYWVMVALCCLIAIVWGGKPGIWGAGIFTTKTVAGFFAALLDQTWRTITVPVLTVDILSFLAFTILALRCDRYWPLWASGCALGAVAIHLATLIETGVRPAVYHGLKGLMAIPMLLLMVRGIYLDRLQIQRSGKT